MPSVSSLLDRYPKYKEDFYKSEEKVYCKFCKCVVDHQKKHNLDSHLKTNKHGKEKKIAKA
ncbi:6315_t:CDS:1, partial [Cetraspora pellucida]